MVAPGFDSPARQTVGRPCPDRRQQCQHRATALRQSRERRADSTPTTRASTERSPGQPRRRTGLLSAPASAVDGTWSAPSGTRVPRLVHNAKGSHLRCTEVIAKQSVPRDRRHGESHVRPCTAGTTSPLVVASLFHVKQPRWRLGGATWRSRGDQRAQPQEGPPLPHPLARPVGQQTFSAFLRASGSRE